TGNDLEHLRGRGLLLQRLGKVLPSLGEFAPAFFELLFQLSAGFAAEQRDELATVHSITSSASASNLSGISRPSALAVLPLKTSSSLFICSTGKSAGLTPLRMRPT